MGITDADGMLECWKSGIMGEMLSFFRFSNLPSEESLCSIRFVVGINLERRHKYGRIYS